LALKLADRVDRQCGGVGFPRAGDACLQPLHLFDDPRPGSRACRGLRRIRG
jgi:hypothetical protein